MDQAYRELFFGEAQDYLREINRALVKLEKNPHDTEAINVVFRLMHTLKGMSATMGYNELAEFAHGLEDVFDSFRSGGTSLTADIMDTVFDSVDAFIVLVEDFKKEKPPSIDIKPHLSCLKEILSVTEVKIPATVAVKKETVARINKEEIKLLKASGFSVFNVEVVLQQSCLMKGARAFTVLNWLRNNGEIKRVSPSEEDLKEERFGFAFDVVLATKENAETVKNHLSRISDIEKIEVSLFDEEIDTLVQKRDQIPEAMFKKIQNMRIPVERLDKIMNLMGELSIARSRLTQTVQSKNYASLEETSYIIERLVTSLQDESLKLRLTPVSYLLNSFPRIVRDLARKENKDIDLYVTGSDIELDRVILDEMGDPMLHIIRNAIDHGIELPEDRESKGKSRRGTIAINVGREKGHIVMEISDDGKGVDFSAIAQKGLEKGLITAEEAAHPDVRVVLEVLAAPGFSTKTEITEVSGRGVGLDVVKNKLDALGGRMHLESEPGKGSKFTLTLPLSLAIIKAMLVSIGSHIYAIPLMNIRETVKVHKNTIKLVKDIEVIRLRDEVIPMLRMRQRLGIKFTEDEADEIAVVIVDGVPRSIGLAVDKVIGEQDIVVKPLSSLIKRIKGITGATILADGRVALILDVASVK